MISRSVRLHKFGKPEEVAVLEPVEVAAPKRGQLLLKMLVTPINPADINFIEGNYGILPDLPVSPGIEGCAEVIISHATGFQPGDRIIFIERVGTWQSHLVCDAEKVLRIDPRVDPEQAAMLKVNPATAWQILHSFEKLQAGEWVIQNAANSGVGQCLIQIAKLMGIRTINTVRREELYADLKQLGADHVFLDDVSLVQKVNDICGDNLPKLASNAVGGDSAVRQMDTLAESGIQVTYGAMSKRSLKVPNKFLIFKGINLRGLWITKWLAHANPDEIAGVYRQIGEWVVDGKLKQAVDRCYSANDLQQALKHSQQIKRDGKILLDWRIVTDPAEE